MQQYIIDKNGNSESPESIVSILDPFTAYEFQNNFTKPREQLHNALALHFSYYRLGLATAEAWLEYYNQQKTVRRSTEVRGKIPGANALVPGGSEQDSVVRQAYSARCNKLPSIF